MAYRAARSSSSGIRSWRVMALAGISFVALSCASMPAAFAQQATFSDSLKLRAASDKKQPMLVEADQLVYDNDSNTVSARGNAQVYYDRKTIQADRITYDRGKRRVHAEGRVRIVDEKGNITTSDRLELTDDFRDGFIDSLRVETPDKTRFSAARGERSGGEITTFERGTYTPCETCKDNPQKPPLWQVKAAKIVHNNEARTIYYENATFEFMGVPVAWLPYFTSPDATVKRASGFLAPRFIASSALGTGASIPYFWALAPNYDLTLTPSYMSRQGFLGQAEWRHRLSNGSYNIKVSGIVQQDKSAFLSGKLGGGGKDFRGSIETSGRFFINDKWQWGWNITALTDRWYLSNYKLRPDNLNSFYYQEATSSVFLRGQGDRSYFDLSTYHFQPLSTYDWQKQQPVVHPVLDYNKRFDGPNPLGGEVQLDVNFTSLSRGESEYRELDPTIWPRNTVYTIPNPLNPLQPTRLYDTCAVYAVGRCLVRGAAGTYSRFTASLNWRRPFIDGIGQVWTPFAGVRVDGSWFSPTFTGAANSLGIANNAYLTNFTGNKNDFAGQVMPTIGLEYRFPFVGRAMNATHIIEPIAQILARPSELRVAGRVNNDATSLVFDDTNLFAWDKYSGYDRVEGGVRANIGMQYTAQFDNGAYSKLLFGQSYHLAGRNSFSNNQVDISNVGFNSGLDDRRSDYVGRFQVSPSDRMNFVVRARFDEQNFASKRFEAQASIKLTDQLVTGITYANYAPQPLLGYPFRREGLMLNAKLNLNKNWFVTGELLADLDRYLVNRELNKTLPPGVSPYNTRRVQLAGMSLGIGYQDECTTFSVAYQSTYNDPSLGLRERNQSVVMRLELRTLGDVRVRQSLTQTGTQDGLSVPSP